MSIRLEFEQEQKDEVSSKLYEYLCHLAEALKQGRERAKGDRLTICDHHKGSLLRPSSLTTHSSSEPSTSGPGSPPPPGRDQAYAWQQRLRLRRREKRAKREREEEEEEERVSDHRTPGRKEVEGRRCARSFLLPQKPDSLQAFTPSQLRFYINSSLVSKSRRVAREGGSRGGGGGDRDRGGAHNL